MSGEKNRLTKIYTRRGDSGYTALATGERLSKADMKVQLLGEVDELNCQLGVVISSLSDDSQLEQLRRIQHRLFDLGGQLAMDNQAYIAIEAQHIDQLEQSIDAINQHLPPLKEFILPGGSLSAAHCHLARAVCRRVERQWVLLLEQNLQHKSALKYLNRLSDYLFVCARQLARDGEHGEIHWQKGY
ncbi:MAG: cob(I)yrinic acid a,c-diamide adenosyltransferase [Pseudomonadales bacterium]